VDETENYFPENKIKTIFEIKNIFLKIFSRNIIVLNYLTFSKISFFFSNVIEVLWRRKVRCIFSSSTLLDNK